MKLYLQLDIHMNFFLAVQINHLDFLNEVLIHST
jgi:hypothetical protein